MHAPSYLLSYLSACLSACHVYLLLQEAEMLEGCETAEYGDQAAAYKVSKCIAYMPPLLKRAMEAQQLMNLKLED